MRVSREEVHALQELIACTRDHAAALAEGRSTKRSQTKLDAACLRYERTQVEAEEMIANLSH